MSMLADLLSKVHQPVIKREVAPNLKNIVKASSGWSAHKTKIIVLSAIFVISALSGIFFVRYVKSISGQSDITIASASLDTVRQKIRERQAASSESSSPLQSSKPGDLDVQNKAQGTAQPVISEEVSGGAIADEKSRKSDIVSADKDHREAPQGPQGSPAGVTLENGESENTGMNVMAENPKKKVKEVEIINFPDTALHAESKRTHGMDAYLYRAREDEIKGDYSKALTNYKKALELDRDNYAVMNNVAYIFLRLNLIDESIKYARMAVDINRAYAPALINLGIAYARSGDITSAEENLRSALGLEPDNQDVLMNLGILHERQDLLQEASEYFSRLVKLGSMDGPMGLARVYEKQGRIEEAVKLYRSVYENASADEMVKLRARQRIMVLKNNNQ